MEINILHLLAIFMLRQNPQDLKFSAPAFQHPFTRFLDIKRQSVVGGQRKQWPFLGSSFLTPGLEARGAASKVGQFSPALESFLGSLVQSLLVHPSPQCYKHLIPFIVFLQLMMSEYCRVRHQGSQEWLRKEVDRAQIC